MDTEKILVTVIVPIYNVEKYIERCADSLFKQTLEQIEFIFVDDCSQDNSVQVLNEVHGNFPNRLYIVIRNENNMGVSYSRSLGISRAKGEYLAFCDSDDWVEPDMYNQMYNAAKKRNADILTCGFVEHRDEKFFFHAPKREFDAHDLLFDFNCFGGLYGSLCNKLIRKDFLISNDKHLWSGISMWEDSCFLVPLRLKSKSSYFLNKCFYHYNVNVGSVTTNYSLKKVQDSIIAVKRLEDFFLEEGFYSESRVLIRNLKIASKEVLLKYPSIDNIILFRKTFPETNRFLWCYPNWGFLLKLRAWLAAILPLNIAYLVVKIMRK